MLTHENHLIVWTASVLQSHCTLFGSLVHACACCAALRALELVAAHLRPEQVLQDRLPAAQRLRVSVKGCAQDVLLSVKSVICKSHVPSTR